jgi:single-strand DNA-binding protein
MYQKILLIGNIGRDPVERFTKDGKQLAEFSLAVSEGSGDRRTTAWFRCTAWEKTAGYLLAYAGKGAKVLIEGRLSYDANGGPRLWTGNDGTTRAAFEVTVSSATIITRADGASQAMEQPKPAGQAQPKPAADDFEVDIPY